jgi:hypothetical protein
MISFDEIRDTMPDKAAKDDETLERALSILPVRTLLGMTPKEMGVVTLRFEARIKQAARGDAE